MMHLMLAGLMATHAQAPAAVSVVPATSSADALLAQPAAPVTADPPPLTDEVIKKAVHDMIVEDPHLLDTSGNGGVVYGARTPYGKFDAAFNHARIPSCLHEDALKHQPAYIGPVAVVGVYSLPWLVAAVVNGKCN